MKTNKNKLIVYISGIIFIFGLSLAVTSPNVAKAYVVENGSISKADYLINGAYDTNGAYNTAGAYRVAINVPAKKVTPVVKETPTCKTTPLNICVDSSLGANANSGNNGLFSLNLVGWSALIILILAIIYFWKKAFPGKDENQEEHLPLATQA